MTSLHRQLKEGRRKTSIRTTPLIQRMVVVIRDGHSTANMSKLPRICRKVAETLIDRSKPQKQVFLTRNFLRFEEFSEELKKDMNETLSTYDTYRSEEKVEMERYDIHSRTIEDQEEEWAIQERIFQIRKRQVAAQRGI